MTYTAQQITVTDENGSPVEGATVDVFIAGTSHRASIYADSTGTLLDNPFTSDARGVARFYAAAGLYRIVVTHDGDSTEMPDVPVGSAQGYDVGEDDDELLTRAQAEALFARPKHNLLSSSAPTEDDDETKGYSRDSLWAWNTGTALVLLICDDPAAGSAVWVPISLQ